MRVRPVTRESEGEGIPNRRDDPARRVRTGPLLVGESFEFVEQGLYLAFNFVPDFADVSMSCPSGFTRSHSCDSTPYRAGLNFVMEHPIVTEMSSSK